MRLLLTSLVVAVASLMQGCTAYAAAPPQRTVSFVAHEDAPPIDLSHLFDLDAQDHFGDDCSVDDDRLDDDNDDVTICVVVLLPSNGGIDRTVPTPLPGAPPIPTLGTVFRPPRTSV